LLSESGKARNVLICRVAELHNVLPALEHQGHKIEHLYDY